MPKSLTKSRLTKPSAATPATAKSTAARSTVGRPPRAPGHARRQIVVDTSLLSEAMRLTGRGQSDTVNAALARMTENAAILEGVEGLFGAFPSHGDDSHGDDEDRP